MKAFLLLHSIKLCITVNLKKHAEKAISKNTKLCLLFPLTTVPFHMLQCHRTMNDVCGHEWKETHTHTKQSTTTTAAAINRSTDFSTHLANGIKMIISWVEIWFHSVTIWIWWIQNWYENRYINIQWGQCRLSNSFAIVYASQARLKIHFCSTLLCTAKYRRKTKYVQKSLNRCHKKEIII